MLLLIVALISCKLTIIIASCPDKEVPSFCDGGDFIQQAYCGSAEQNDVRWTCTKKNKVRCGCAAPYFRRSDGQCVLEQECGNVEGQVDHPPQPTFPSRPGEDYEIPTSLQGSHEDLPKVKKFLQQNGSFHLVEISEDMWAKHNCTCLESKFKKKTILGSWREIYCYIYLPVIKAPSTAEKKVGQKALGRKWPVEALFKATQHGWTFVTVSTGADEITEQGTNQQENTGQSSSVEDYVLTDRYITLDVHDNCLLLSYGNWAGGNSRCMIWATLTADGSYDKESAKCQETKRNLCRDDMSVVWTDDCKELYNYHERTDKKAAQELLEKQRDAVAN